MSMQTLMSAARAAGYAMAAEELAEPRAEVIVAEPKGTALTVSTQRSTPSDVLKAFRVLRRLWVREWLGAHWQRRAAA